MRKEDAMRNNGNLMRKKGEIIRKENRCNEKERSNEKSKIMWNNEKDEIMRKQNAMRKKNDKDGVIKNIRCDYDKEMWDNENTIDLQASRL